MRDARSPVRQGRSAEPRATLSEQLRSRLRAVREAAGLTQASLAERTGVTRQTIIAIERGGYVPSLALALALARELATPLDELFWLEGGEGDQP